MKEIIIANITPKDCERKQIRILANQKELFPAEQRGFRKIYDVNIIYGNNAYSCTYRIGSRDGRARSGVLCLYDGLGEVLANKNTKKLALKWKENNEYHLTLFAL
ncbi:MAG TPA: hypothetical protein VK518_19920 [Puia sp.]|nr:hypothetical protein [Puia sp.]